MTWVRYFWNHRLNTILGIVGAALIAWNAVLSWQQWRDRPVPWMSPEVVVTVVKGQPLVSFLGSINTPAVGASWGAKVEAIGVPLEICQGRGVADYQLNETRPALKSLEWWVGTELCEQRLQPGIRYRLITTWCNQQGECHEAYAVWRQPG